MLNFILSAILWIFFKFPDSKQSKSTDKMSLLCHESVHHLCSSPPSTQVFWLPLFYVSHGMPFFGHLWKEHCVCSVKHWPRDHSHEQLTSLECVLIGLNLVRLFLSLITLLLWVGPHYKSRSPAKVQIYWGWKAWTHQLNTSIWGQHFSLRAYEWILWILVLYFLTVYFVAPVWSYSVQTAHSSAKM